MTADTGTPGVDAATANGQAAHVPPEEIADIFDQADTQAALAQLAASVDRQRRQLILMWIAVLGLAGALTFLTIQARRDA